MQNLFTETFFKFLLGFVAILLASMVVLVIAGGYVGEGDIAADTECLPEEMC